MQKWKCFIEKQNKIILTLHRPNHTKVKTYRKGKTLEQLYNIKQHGKGRYFFQFVPRCFPMKKQWGTLHELHIDKCYVRAQKLKWINWFRRMLWQPHNGNCMWHRMKWQAYLRHLKISFTLGTGLYSWPERPQQSQGECSGTCPRTIPSTLLPLTSHQLCWCLSNQHQRSLQCMPEKVQVY